MEIRASRYRYQFLGLVGQDAFLFLYLFHLCEYLLDLFIIFLLERVRGVPSMLSYVSEDLTFPRIFFSLVF